MSRRQARKPHILKHKAELANLIKENWQPRRFFEHNSKKYWKGLFYSENGIHIWVYFQYYVRRNAVDYINLRYNDVGGRALTPNEIKELLNKVKSEK